MSERLLHRTVIVGGAAAIALSAWLIGRASSVSAPGTDAAAASSNVAVDCEPTQQALVRQVQINGEARTVVQCVTSGAETTFVRETAPMGTPGLVPAVYRPAQPVRAVAPAAPTPARTVAAPAPQRVVAERPVASERSWQTRALVIGGSTGAGAGIGALIGGKKGALIGAAIGGGGGTVYEIVKH
jgi:hypothetical protein